jgi:Wiskott-Aldrich syndrome protein
MEKIGMPANKKQTKKDLDMIYDIIDQNGGMQQLERELKNPPPPPSRAPPQAPIVTSSLSYNRSEKTFEPKVRDLPRTPPTLVSNNSRPVQQPTSTKPGPPPHSGNGPPPPPAPPLPQNLMGTHPPAPPPPPPPIPSGGRSNLLSEISQGVQLKTVQSNESIHTSRSADSRDAMLNDIKEGVSLRPVDKQERQRVPPEELGGIAGALLKAMTARRDQIETDSDEDTDDEDDENEWDD